MVFTKAAYVSAVLLVLFGFFDIYYIFAHQYPTAGLGLETTADYVHFAGVSGLTEDLRDAAYRILIGVAFGVLAEISKHLRGTDNSA